MVAPKRKPQQRLHSRRMSNARASIKKWERYGDEKLGVKVFYSNYTRDGLRATHPQIDLFSHPSFWIPMYGRYEYTVLGRPFVDMKLKAVGTSRCRYLTNWARYIARVV